MSSPERTKIESREIKEEEVKSEKPEIEIDLKLIRRLETVAKVVGGDYGMKVGVGEPGEGSYFDNKEVAITFDPLHIKEDPGKVIFVAGHEGSHRAITRSPQELGVKEKKIKELYSKLGFGYLQNIIEDAAVNDWLKERFPGMEPYEKKVYDKSFEKENVPMVTPEVEKVIQQLGYIPKFVQYGSEVLRKWHKGEFSEKLDPEVKTVLDKTVSQAEDSWKTIPSTKYRKEKEIKKKAKERFLTNTKDIWPEVEKLTKEDKENEKQRQTLQEVFDQLPEDIKKGLKEKMEQGQKELEESYQKEQQGKSEKEKQDLEKQRKENQEKFGIPVPIDKLSKKEKKEIDKILKELPEEKKKEIENKSKQTLKEVEDKINKNFEGKLNKEKAPSHQEIEQGTKEQKEKQELSKKEKEEKQEMERVRKELEELREKSKTEYDKVYQEVKPLIDELYNKLERIFRKELLTWEKGFPSGSKLDISKAMQYEADKTKYKELWLRKTLPEKKDYAFSFLVDLSGSMSGEKIKETFKGTVVLSEVLHKLGIPFEIKGFSTDFSGNIKEYKDFNKKLSKETRQILEKIPEEVGGYTPTAQATDRAAESINKQRNENRYLITLTDGQPDNSEALKERIEGIKKKGKIKQIGIGLGPKAEYVKDFYPAHLYLEKVNPSKEEKKQGKKDFSEAIAKLVENMIKYPQKY